MNRLELFQSFVENCQKKSQWVGQGNPLSDILIVGKEPAISANSHDDIQKEILKNIQWNVEGLTSKRFHISQGLTKKNLKAGHTWRKYQLLADYIFNNGKPSDENIINFENDIFTTEANNTVSKRTNNAEQAFKERKHFFLEPCCDFIRSFPVTILACGNYYTNYGQVREIDSIYNVTFDKDGEKVIMSEKGKPYKFWIHHNADRSRLLIHTRQLSTDIPNALLQAIAKCIKQHMKDNK